MWGRHQAGRAPTVTAVVAALALAACSGEPEAAPSSTPSCPKPVPKPAKEIAANTIYVNIVNASSKAGLAGDTAVEVGWRGYRVLETGNQSMTDNSNPKTAEIRYGESGKQIALTLAQEVENPVLAKIDRGNPTVDLVLGEKFKLNPVPPPEPSSVTVNVYNTTWRPGLAGEVAQEYKKRGFKIKTNGNAPNQRWFPDDSVVIFHGPQGEPAARRAQLQIQGARLVEEAGRKGTEVDVYIGNKYKELRPVAEATPPPRKEPAPPAGCS